jgi:hypothetical protein
MKAKRPKKLRTIAALDLKERQSLLAMLNSDVMQKALGNAQAMKPGVFFAGAGTQAGSVKDAAMATLLANNRLHEIRGWESFEAALFAQCEDPKPARSKLDETFPDET